MADPTFQRIALPTFRDLLVRFPFTRKVNAVHMHHTWKPTRGQFAGHETIVAMWRHHTQTNGWSDIAQHITIDPNGEIWLGRNWNRPPASAAGHNGNAAFGPFMFEMVGNFDVGRDAWDGPQRETTLEVIAAIQAHFDLPLQSLRLHNMMSPKSCPGTSIDFATVLRDVQALRDRPREAVPRGSDSPFAQEAALQLRDAMESLQREPLAVEEPADAEPDEYADHAHAAGAKKARGTDGAVRPRPIPRTPGLVVPLPPRVGGAGVADRGFGDELPAAVKAALRPHVISLRAGCLSDSDTFDTTAEDVRAIFDEHLPRAIAAAGAATPLNVVCYAHGGLVDESAALRQAQRHIAWWLANGVYPIYFVWHTGFLETVVDVLLGRARDARGVGDWAIENLARALGGPAIWMGIKASARRAGEGAGAGGRPAGGAHLAMEALAAFCKKEPNRLRLHAVCHSAGSIFIDHLLEAARTLGVPAFESLQMLAPAITVEAFGRRVKPHVGANKTVKRATMFALERDLEWADRAGPYGHSLLVLVSRALEERRKTALLGLQESVRADPTLVKWFGLAGAAAEADVVWAPSSAGFGRSASAAKRHQDFDDDKATMGSVMRRVLDLDDDTVIDELPDAPRAASAGGGFAQAPAAGSALSPSAASGSMPERSTIASAAAPSPTAPARAVGRRVALCIGIDNYPEFDDRLGGCIADTNRWAAALADLGFETRIRLDGDATRDAIEAELLRLMRESRPGDHIVFQYAGHGMSIPDLNGDEVDGNDESLCPWDFRDGRLWLDDDIARLVDRLPQGVAFTWFTDSCHSQSNTRVAALAGTTARGAGLRVRQAKVTPATLDAHRRDRQARGGWRAAIADDRGALDVSRQRIAKFAACRDDQLAWEEGGSGVFTRAAVPLLRQAVEAGISNDAFLGLIVEHMGTGGRQEPWLDCEHGLRSAALLGASSGRVGAGDAPSGVAVPAASAAAGVRDVALHHLARAMFALTATTDRLS